MRASPHRDRGQPPLAGKIAGELAQQRQCRSSTRSDAPGQMTYDLRRLRLDGLIRRIERVKT